MFLKISQLVRAQCLWNFGLQGMNSPILPAVMPLPLGIHSPQGRGTCPPPKKNTLGYIHDRVQFEIDYSTVHHYGSLAY